MLTYEIAKRMAENACERWLKLNGLTITDHALVIDYETIDTDMYNSLIEEIALEFEGLG